jgi:hypothetical protein
MPAAALLRAFAALALFRCRHARRLRKSDYFRYFAIFSPLRHYFDYFH